MTIRAFDASQTKLLKGINLIEASAGTGKTYAIAMLALRFIAEQGLSIEELLIVTFTKAATEELKERIRRRLSEARRLLNGRTGEGDSNLLSWAEHLPVGRSLARQRIEVALLNIDQAGIFTIHGFCQRVLREHALESGQLFDSELIGDVDAVRQEIADDFWRAQLYPRAPFEVAVLMTRFDTPESLLESVGKIRPHAVIEPVQEGLEQTLNALNRCFEQAGQVFEAATDVLRGAFIAEKFKATYCEAFEAHCEALGDWLQGNIFTVPQESLAVFTLDGIRGGLNGHKFRTTKTQSGDQRKQEYLDSLGLDTEPFDRLLETVNRATLMFRLALAHYLRGELDKRLQQLNVLSYDDLITRLANALQGEQSAHLIEALRARYKAALIDEFQDTDQAQWHIFSTLFDADSHYLYLIGDPKQAIYKFRGADIFSYFAAKNQAQHHFTLGKNWRSQPQLVEAVNALFKQKKNARPFLFEALDFIEMAPALTAEQGTLHDGGQPAPPMVVWQLAENENANSGYWTAGKAGEAIQIAVVNEIVKLLDRTRPATIVGTAEARPLQPRDIAVLVRTNKQARAYQTILKEAGVPSVLNSTESVFETKEARELFTLIEAVVHPGDIARLKQMLTLDWFGLDGQALYRTIDDEAALDAWLSRFQIYCQLWHDDGFMAMLEQLLAQEQVRSQLAHGSNAERRLTNLNHLIELVQQAAVDGHLGPHKTVDWLLSEISTASQRGEEQELRLESDEEAVKIVTMHRSKGLEYPVVFCPYLWDRNMRLTSESLLIECHENDTLVADLGSEAFEQRREQALNEDLAEDLRLFYVAVTRAKFHCYIAWADVRTKDNPNSSGMAYLLHAEGFEAWQEELTGLDFAMQQQRLQTLCERSPQAFEYRLIETPVELEGSYVSPVKQQTLQALRQQRSLLSDWQMSSYTALAALSTQEEPELPLDKAQEPPASAAADEEEPEIPKGAHTGNVVHDLLENCSFEAIAAGDDMSEARDAACRRYGLKLDEPGRLDALLRQVVQTPLSADDPHFSLANLNERCCLKEMPFYLAMDSSDTARINEVLRDSAAFQPLHPKTMQGYLTGFIDLVCEYRGRYYVMDYKTNFLANYEPDSMTRAMREHNYGLQYWIYTLVLHRYLQNRLADYDYRTHFGGIRYLFVRGMQPERVMSGVYQDYPDLERLNALAAVLGETP
jgi:exodeoxyribonuclease V beta subunit